MALWSALVLVMSLSTLAGGEALPKKVDVIAPFAVADDLSDKDTAQIKTLVAKLDADEAPPREAAERALIEWTKTDPRVFIRLFSLRSLTVEQRLRIERVLGSSPPEVTWNQARIQLFESAKQSQLTRTIFKAVSETMALLTDEQKRSLSQSAADRVQAKAERAQSAGSPFAVAQTSEEFEEEILQKLRDEVKVFSEAARRIGYTSGELEKLKEGIYFLPLSHEGGDLLVVFHSDEDLIYAQVAGVDFFPTAKGVFGFPVTLPGRQPFHGLSDNSLFPMITFSWNGEKEFHLQAHDIPLIRKGVLFGVDSFLERAYPESANDIRELQLTAEGEKKLRSFQQ